MASRGLGLPLVGGVMVLMLVAGAIGVFFVKREKQPTHVVLIVLDTVRADRLGCYGHSRSTTPRLDAFAAEGLRFTAARSPSPWTLPSHASLFTGMTPAEHGCTWEAPVLAEGWNTVAERIAADAGYETFGISSNVNASRRFGLDQGFETFLQTWELREAHPGRDDSSILQSEVEEWLEHRDDSRPFFLFLNYLDVHLPYTPSPPYDRMFGEVGDAARELGARAPLLRDLLRREVKISPELWEELGRLYDGELRQLDDRVGQLLDLLDEKGLADQTLVIITSDHGELLGEDGLADHQLSLREELLAVPLMVRWPRRVLPGVIDPPTSLVQVGDWILEAAEGRVPRWTPSPEDEPAFLSAEYARPLDLLHFLREHGLDASPYDRRRLAITRREGGRHLKYELDSHGSQRLLELGPAGERSLGEESVDLMERFRQRVERDPLRRTFLAAPPGPGGAPPRDSAAWKELVALGYLSAQPRDLEAVAALLLSAIETRRSGEYDRARKILERGLLVHPGHPDLLFARAETLTLQGEPAGAAWRRFLDAASEVGETDGERCRKAREHLAEADATDGA